MKAVILAAGKSTRLHPLTVNRSKVMLTVANLTILEYNLQQLQQTKLIDEAVIVVGFGSEEVMTKFGNHYGKIKLAYAFQTEQLGTGHALLQAEKFLAGEKKFLALMGDDLYFSGDFKKCIPH
ncbi:NTP transferase domain-containing protein, partial [Candidatus Woesearchaeota archaeon]|nr:NTP transferase domain-containing protein [Candidatus Woesearchaeota archaeon]